MTSLAAKNLLIELVLPVISSHGYTLKKVQSPDFELIKKTNTGANAIIGGFTDYNPVQQIIYSFAIRNNTVNEILIKLQDSGINLGPKITRSSYFMGFSYSSLKGMDSLNYLPDVKTEGDMIIAANAITDFALNTAFPIMERFEDIKEVDRIINDPTPWTTDWQMPYAFGGHFYLIRMIVARLAENPNYLELADFNYKAMERLSAENGSPFTYDRNDMSKPLPVLLKLLEAI
jgi:hypothetical protein